MGKRALVELLADAERITGYIEKEVSLKKERKLVIKEKNDVCIKRRQEYKEQLDKEWEDNFEKLWYDEHYSGKTSTDQWGDPTGLCETYSRGYVEKYIIIKRGTIPLEMLQRHFKRIVEHCGWWRCYK
jgi:hypothetical protein